MSLVFRELLENAYRDLFYPHRTSHILCTDVFLVLSFRELFVCAHIAQHKLACIHHTMRTASAAAVLALQGSSDEQRTMVRSPDWNHLTFRAEYSVVAQMCAGVFQTKAD